MKYLFRGKKYSAPNKDDVLRQAKITISTKNLRLVWKMKKGENYG